MGIGGKEEGEVGRGADVVQFDLYPRVQRIRHVGLKTTEYEQQSTDSTMIGYHPNPIF